jgi:hypothetical protein
MNESEYERIIEQRVSDRLSHDKAYLDATNAHEQAKRQDEITREEETRLNSEITRSEIERGEQV